MEELQIPSQYQSGIRKIHELSAQQAEALLSVLTSEPPTLHGRNLVACVQSRVDEIESEVTAEITHTLLALHAFRSFLDVSVNEFVEDIGSADNFAVMEIPEADFESLRARLAEFLRAKPLSITSKAMNVLMAHEHVLHNARILTDVRAVFDDEDDLSNSSSNSLAAAVIVHMLALRCRDNGDLKEYYIALDTEDVRDLQLTLERANSKAKILQNTLKEAGIPYLEIESESK